MVCLNNFLGNDDLVMTMMAIWLWIVEQFLLVSFTGGVFYMGVRLVRSIGISLDLQSESLFKNGDLYLNNFKK